MDEKLDEKPIVLLVAQCDQLAATVKEAALSAGCQFMKISELSEWNETQAQPDQQTCVVLDYTSPEVFSAPNAIIWLRDVMGLLVVTDPDDADGAFHAACMGASKVINRPVASLELEESFQVLFGTHPILRIDSGSSRSIFVQQYQELKDRQKDVLRLLMLGEANKGVAAKLDIGLRTVESDRASMMRTFRVDSFAELIRCATIAVEQMRLIRARVLARSTTMNGKDSNH